MKIFCLADLEQLESRQSSRAAYLPIHERTAGVLPCW